MEYSKHRGLIQVGVFRIMKLFEDPSADIHENVLNDIVAVLAKYDVVTEDFIFTFTENDEISKKDLLQLSLIKAGVHIEKERNKES